MAVRQNGKDGDQGQRDSGDSGVSTGNEGFERAAIGSGAADWREEKLGQVGTECQSANPDPGAGAKRYIPDQGHLNQGGAEEGNALANEDEQGGLPPAGATHGRLAPRPG